jgi:16S rRNA (cytosine967-C5)-methyltransferase
MSSARTVALRCLERIDHEGAYANLVVPAELASSRLDTRDRAFVTDLVYGTTRYRRACDALIDRFVLTEPQPLVRTVLRLGAYQIAFAEVAPHAAVGETVSLAPRSARGFVNAVLRKVVATPMRWPDRATEVSYPQWLFERLVAELGDEAECAMERMNQPAPVSVRDDGYTQDRASQWVAASVGALAGELVCDMAAAPGGKAIAMAARTGAGGAFVVAHDLSIARAGLMRSNAIRLGADLAVVVGDGVTPAFRPGSFDHVLLDAPCSGLGALRRRPDARWRIRSADIDDLVALQRRMLAAAASLVRAGGSLTYSVCTVTAAESVEHPVPDGFCVLADRPVGTWKQFHHGWRVLPHDDDTDGMVLVRYRRDA